MLARLTARPRPPRSHHPLGRRCVSQTRWRPPRKVQFSLCPRRWPPPLAERGFCPSCLEGWESVLGPGSRWAGRGLFTPGRAWRTGAAGARDAPPRGPPLSGPLGFGEGAVRGAPYITAAAETGRCAGRGRAGALRCGAGPRRGSAWPPRRRGPARVFHRRRSSRAGAVAGEWDAWGLVRGFVKGNPGAESRSRSRTLGREEGTAPSRAKSSLGPVFSWPAVSAVPGLVTSRVLKFLFRLNSNSSFSCCFLCEVNFEIYAGKSILKIEIVKCRCRRVSRSLL